MECYSGSHSSSSRASSRSEGGRDEDRSRSRFGSRSGRQPVEGRLDPQLDSFLATLSPEQRVQMFHHLQQDPNIANTPTRTPSFRSASVRESVTHGGTDTVSSSALERSQSSSAMRSKGSKGKDKIGESSTSIPYSINADKEIIEDNASAAVMTRMCHLCQTEFKDILID